MKIKPEISAEADLGDLPVETHPWEPFTPPGARFLIMGTFPPAEHRHAINFYYPNPINDFWRIMGLIYLGDPQGLWDTETKKFDLEAIKSLMIDKGIALNDTVRRARRLMGNASDKFLDVVEPVPLAELLKQIPACTQVATTGQKAAEIIAEITGTHVPRMGEYVYTVFDGRELRIWRMPSTSRAYPMKLEKKAEYYRRLLCP